eukprot:TRINITY_DN61939_c0_g1_i1.p1 TRINITY_DN61939_c0_g1~~TRINITY_DN61939_c0_g1_i1.p1  ORF type:complete len:968 (+),score=220.22 TRINITY_DN61939_c0_g1_i1:119-3022(+)
MVKAYLRFENERAVGVVTSRECNVAFDKSGRFALTGCIEALGVWNLRQGVQERALATSQGSERVTRICVREAAGDGKSVCAVGYVDGSVRLWNFQEGSLLQTLQGHRSAVSCLAFDKAGHSLASGSNDTDIVIWDLVAESGVARLKGHVDQVTAVLFWEASAASSARLISSSKDRLIRIWSLEMQICVQAIAEHRLEVWSLALSSSQTRLVAGSGDKFLRVWALAEPEATTTEAGEPAPLATFLGALPRTEGQGNALGLQFAQPKGAGFEALLCQGSGKTLEVFRCFNDAEVRHRQKRRKRRVAAKQKKKAGQAGDGEDADADGSAAADADPVDDGVHAADEFMNLQTHRCSAKAISMAWCEANSSVLLGLTNNVLESVRLVTGKADQAEGGRTLEVQPSVGLELAGHRTGVRALSVAHDDSVFMSAASESVKIWSASTGRCVRTMPSGYGLCGFFVAGNEHVLLGTKEGKLELFNVQLGEQTQTLDAHGGAIYGLAERPDHQGFASCSADRTLRFFEFTFTKGADASVTFAEQADRATELPDELLAVSYSPNGKWIAVALLNHTVQVLFADTLKFYISLYGHRLPVMSIDMSDDSQMIASGSADKNVRLWSSQFGNCLKSLKAHDESVMQVRFMPGTHYLVTAGRDHKLKLWDCDSYELISTLAGHACEVLAMALSQDASFIITAGSDKQIRMWRRSQEQLFLSEERAKEMEEQFEQEVEREDVQPGPGMGGGEAVVLRASRRTVESVRTTERLMEVLDEAKAGQEQLESEEAEGGIDLEALKGFGQGARHPCARAIAYINTLNASNIYEVLLALPFSHALILMRVITRFFDAVAALPGGEGAAARAKVLSAAASLETPCQAALITAYVHHSEFAATASARPLLLQLRSQMRSLLQAEKDRIGLTMAGFAHLQRSMKRTSAGSLSAAGAGIPKADADRVANDRGRGRGRGRSASGGRGRGRKKQRR